MSRFTIDRSKYLTPQQVRRLRDVTLAWKVQDLEAGRRQGVVAWMLIDLLLSSGVRASEAASVRCGDLNRRDELLTVRSLKKRTGRNAQGFVLERIAVPRKLCRHIDDFILWKQVTGEPCEPGNALLRGQRGPITRKGIWCLVGSALERAEITDHSPHSLRHSYATELLRHSGNPRMVQRQLRHARLDTTMIYADSLPEDTARAVERMYQGGGVRGEE